MSARNDATPNQPASTTPLVPLATSPDALVGGLLLPVTPNPDDYPDRAPGSNAATAASAAGARALSGQLVAFYFRAPAKAFFRTRVDYLAYARTVHREQLQRMQDTNLKASHSQLLLRHAWLWMRSTTPGVLTLAIKQQGWRVVPRQILPPLMANAGVGAVLYTSYLHILGQLHEDSAKATRRVYPPPSPVHTLAAGFLAGALQSVLAAPLDALQARHHHHDLTDDGKSPPRSMWAFGSEKLREIGLRGIFAGWGLSLAKDSLGSAVFFSTFECVKAQGYYRFVTWYYGGLDQHAVDLLAMKRPLAQGDDGHGQLTVIRPHYAIEPMFLLLAGLGASSSQQLLLHPLTHFQVKHWDRLEDLDAEVAKCRQARLDDPPNPRRPLKMLQAYYRAYRETWTGCVAEASSEGLSLTRWLFRDFWWNTIRQVPSTSAGLIIFELIRRKYGFGVEEIRINEDGYDILLD